MLTITFISEKICSVVQGSMLSTLDNAKFTQEFLILYMNIVYNFVIISDDLSTLKTNKVK